MEGKVYRYGFAGGNVGDKSMKDLLGGKGANLAEMANLGLPVPLGITITTDVCKQYRSLHSTHRAAFITNYYADTVRPELDALETELGYAPLYSVRSGARDSMPGMMDTLLNIGLTRRGLPEWYERIGKNVTLDCRRRQLEMWAATVDDNSDLIKSVRAKVGTFKYGLPEAPGKNFDHSPKHVAHYIERLEELVLLPRNRDEQILKGIAAVFESWDSERARDYRKSEGIDDELGTAVNIQMMVFGNRNKHSASGVYFTRNPSTGEAEPYGDIVINGQGEDVVAGTHDTLKVTDLGTALPKAYEELLTIGATLEGVYRDMVDTEFTIESGKLWMLQVRVGQREAKAAFRIAHDLCVEGLIDKGTAVSRVTAKQYAALKKIRIDLDEVPKADYTGIAAGGTLVVGTPVGSSGEAKALGGDTPVILTTDETTPNDFAGMMASVGILTRTGGATSHAAVVGRAYEKHCVVGCSLLPDVAALPNRITLDGATGRVWLTELPLTTGEIDDYARKLFEWGTEGKEGFVIRGSVDERNCDNMYITASDSSLEAVIDFLTYVGHGDTAVKRVFLDLSAPGADMDDTADRLLWNISGTVENPAHAISQARIKEFTLLNGMAGAQAKVILVVPSGTPDATISELRATGWKVVARVSDLKTLLDTDGIVEVDPKFANEVGGKEVAEKLLAMMAKAGEAIEIVPTPISANRLVFEVFNS